jgi:hypothetical protein
MNVLFSKSCALQIPLSLTPRFSGVGRAVQAFTTALAVFTVEKTAKAVGTVITPSGTLLKRDVSDI